MASPPSTINVTAITTPAVLMSWSQLFLFMAYPFLPWAPLTQRVHLRRLTPRDSCRKPGERAGRDPVGVGPSAPPEGRRRWDPACSWRTGVDIVGRDHADVRVALRSTGAHGGAGARR